MKALLSIKSVWSELKHYVLPMVKLDTNMTKTLTGLRFPLKNLYLSKVHCLIGKKNTLIIFEKVTLLNQ